MLYCALHCAHSLLAFCEYSLPPAQHCLLPSCQACLSLGRAGVLNKRAGSKYNKLHTGAEATTRALSV